METTPITCIPIKKVGIYSKPVAKRQGCVYNKSDFLADGRIPMRRDV